MSKPVLVFIEGVINIASAPSAITHTPSAVTEATADIAILLMLRASRREYEAQELAGSGNRPL